MSHYCQMLVIGAYVLLWCMGKRIWCLLFSIWMPQIVRNIKTDERKVVLEFPYVLGVSVTRLLQWGALAFKFVGVETFLKGTMEKLLVAYVGVQCAIIFAQGIFGPRFMIPTFSGFKSAKKYNYHRPIPHRVG